MYFSILHTQIIKTIFEFQELVYIINLYIPIKQTLKMLILNQLEYEYFWRMCKNLS